MAKDKTDRERLTVYDFYICKALLPILIDYAINKRYQIEYGQLVKELKLLNPNDKYVQSCIPISIGKRLNAIRKIIDEYDTKLPDLSCMVVNKTGKSGDAYHLVRKNELAKVQKINWSQHLSIMNHFDALNHTYKNLSFK